MANYDYDVLIIGGGPAGYVAGSYLAQYGRKTAVIEKDKLGGCCLNTGCIPTKTILEAAMRLKHASDSDMYGITADISFDWDKLMSYSVSVRDNLRNGVGRLLSSRKCQVIYGEAAIVGKNEIKVDDSVFSAEYIIIATGTTPMVPAKYADINGVLTSDTFWDLKQLPESMVIVGGGVIGCEIASSLSRLGSKITTVEQQNEILPNINPDAAGILKKELQNDGVTIICGQSVDDIVKTDLGLSVTVGEKTLSCEYVLWSTGRRAVVPSLEGVELESGDRGFVQVDKNYKTSIDNIYCIGDANGIGMLAHASIMQAMQVVNHICTNIDITDTAAIPQTVFSYPSIASIGVLENECKDKNVSIGKVPYAAAGYSHVITSSNGYFKVIRDIDTDTIIGAEIVGYNACELIHILAPYINKKLKARMFADVMFAHPTLSEGIKLAVESSYIRSPQV